MTTRGVYDEIKKYLHIVGTLIMHLTFRPCKKDIVNLNTIWGPKIILGSIYIKSSL